MAAKRSANPETRRPLDVSKLAADVKAVIRDQAKLASAPATDARLARIWPPWNALPPDMLPEEKARILTFDKAADNYRGSEESALVERLHEQFDYLPLDKNQFEQALVAASRWSTLIAFYQTTVELYLNVVEVQWAFGHVDANAAARIAILRAAKELQLTHPGLLEAGAPKLTDIELLLARYNAYADARRAALVALVDLIVKLPDMHSEIKLRLKEQALGVPRVPEGVLRHLYIARLIALGICSPTRQRDFERDEWPKLSLHQRQTFDRIRRKPRFGKEPYAAFAIWVLDNRPIFENQKFGWKWKHIMAAAVAKGIQCPKTGLKQWRHRNNLELEIPPGPSTTDSTGARLSASLLSPPPVFGDVIS